MKIESAATSHTCSTCGHRLPVTGPARRYPEWLGELTVEQESLRHAHGLYPARDGWYKTIKGQKRYIASTVPLAEAIYLLPLRKARILGHSTTEARTLAGTGRA